MNFTLRTLWLSVLTLGLLACDRIGQDMAPTDTDAADADVIGTELFALPDNKAAVDLTTLSSLQQTATYQISRQPQSGTLSFTANGLLLYQPNPDFLAGDDDFLMSTMQQGVAMPVPVSVRMAADAEAAPCEAGALPDRAETPVGQRVRIVVLKNDKVCNGTLNVATLRIAVAPKAGTVQVEGETIVYTPTSTTFAGRDEFIYKICDNGGSTPTCYLAPVVVVIGSPGRDCQIVLRDDRVVYRHLFVTDSLIIPVLANDQLCQSNRSLPVTITKTPTKGVAYTLMRSSMPAIVYKPAISATGVDNLTYQRCVNGNCAQAVVRLQTRTVEPDCRLIAKNDQRIASLSTDAEAKAGRLLIPVLANDKICAPIATMRIVGNPSGLNVRVRNGVIVYTLGAVPQKGTHRLTYELVDTENSRVTAQVKVSLNE